VGGAIAPSRLHGDSKIDFCDRMTGAAACNGLRYEGGRHRGRRRRGMKQPVWQIAACELQDIMQFVTVKYRVEGPLRGVTTFGVCVACASRILVVSRSMVALEEITAAVTRVAKRDLRPGLLEPSDRSWPRARQRPCRAHAISASSKSPVEKP
jgi:hypothetical protein